VAYTSRAPRACDPAGCTVAREVGGVGDLLPGARCELRTVVAEQVAGALVDAQPAPLWADVGDADHRTVECRPEYPLARERAPIQPLTRRRWRAASGRRQHGQCRCPCTGAAYGVFTLTGGRRGAGRYLGRHGLSSLSETLGMPVLLGEHVRCIRQCPALASGPRGRAFSHRRPAPSALVARYLLTYLRYVTETLQRCYRTTRRLLHGISGGPHRTSGARSSGVTGVACRVTMRAGRTAGASPAMRGSPLSGYVTSSGAAPTWRCCSVRVCRDSMCLMVHLLGSSIDQALSILGPPE